MAGIDLAGAFRGPGRGKGEMPEDEPQQGGYAGLLRAGGMGLQGVGAGLMSLDPTIEKMTNAQQRATRGSYVDMLHGQQEQNQRGQRNASSRAILGGLDAVRTYLSGGNKTGTDLPAVVNGEGL